MALFENGEHGYLAAPIVRDVMKAYFDKQFRMRANAAAKSRIDSMGSLIQKPEAPAKQEFGPEE